MKNHVPDFQSRLLLRSILFLALLGARLVYADTPFQIIWGMNQTLSGSSSSPNFVPEDAFLVGASPHSLPTIRYYSIGSGDYAYGTTSWLAGTPAYLNFSYSVSTYEYSLNAVSFRVRRSLQGPTQVSLRSSLDGFASDLNSFSLAAEDVFYNVTVPLGLSNLATGVTFRLFPQNTVSNFGVLYVDQIVISGTVTSIVLPVELTYFKARLVEKVVKLDWETASEKDSKEFIIERSQDLQGFEQIGIVKAHGESAERQQYGFTDYAPSGGVNYYRLKMIDTSGAYAYSKLVDVVIRSLKAGFVLSPNPSDPNWLRVKTDMVTPEDMALVNLRGQKIPIGNVNSAGNFVDLFPNQALRSGIYVLSLKLNGVWQRQKVLIP